MGTERLVILASATTLEAAPDGPAPGAMGPSEERFLGVPESGWRVASTCGLIASLLLTSAILGTGTPPQAAKEYVALWVTDLPADFEKVEVSFKGVYAGSQGHALVLRQRGLDLAAHRGPQEAVLIADGHVPHGQAKQFTVEFEGARGFRLGNWYDLALDEPWLRIQHDLAAPASGEGAFLVDFSLSDSLQALADPQGGAPLFLFSPVVAKVYVKDLAEASAEPAAIESGAAQAPAPPPAFREEEAREPVFQVRSRVAPSFEPIPPPSAATAARASTSAGAATSSPAAGGGSGGTSGGGSGGTSSSASPSPSQSSQEARAEMQAAGAEEEEEGGAVAPASVTMGFHVGAPPPPAEQPSGSGQAPPSSQPSHTTTTASNGSGTKSSAASSSTPTSSPTPTSSGAPDSGTNLCNPSGLTNLCGQIP